MLFGAPHPKGDEVFQWKTSGPLMVCRTVGLAYMGSNPPGMVGALGFPCGIRTGRWSHVAWLLRWANSLGGPSLPWLGIPHRRGGSGGVRTMGLAHLWASPPAWSERWVSPPLRYAYQQAGPGHPASAGWLGRAYHGSRTPWGWLSGMVGELGFPTAAVCVPAGGAPQARGRLSLFGEAIKDGCLQTCLCVPHVGSLGSRHPAGGGWPNCSCAL